MTTDEIKDHFQLTIITPCYNEEDSVEECASKVQQVMETQLSRVSYEHIFIDNSSKDDTVSKLRELARKMPRVKVLVNSRNIGPFRSMYSAMSYASGDAVIPMLPADLQDPAEKIPDLYREWLKGYLVVYGERVNRQESLFMRFMRGFYYRIIRLMSETNIPLNSGEFMIIDKRIANEICKLGDHYPYIRGLVAQSTSNSSSIAYTWGKRLKGKSKSNFLALFDQAMNGFVSTSRAPARIALLAGFTIATLSIFGGILSLVATVLGFSQTFPGLPTLIVAVFFFGGLQLFFLGLIGEYVFSIHSQVRQIPREFIIERINF